MRKLFILIRGRIRLFWGFCPACNSDAPEKDNCIVCDNFYGCSTVKETRMWWQRFKTLNQ